MVFAEVNLIKVYLQFQFLVDMQKWTNAMQHGGGGGGGARAEAAIGETDGRAEIFYRVSRILPYPLF